MLFFYIRHGEPTYDPDALTPNGHRQAEAVGKRLSLYELDEIYASSSNRAIQTAAPAAEMLSKEIRILDFANEAHAFREMTVKRRDAEGITWCFAPSWCKEIFHDKLTVELGHKWYDHPAFSEYRDSFKAGMERVRRESDAFFESLGYRNEGGGRYKVIAENDKRVALFAHQGFGAMFLSTVLGIPYPQFASHFDMSYTGVTVIDFREEEGYSYPTILTLANDGHLLREGLSTKYCKRLFF
jgi:probable phosphoglycerate mutase